MAPASADDGSSAPILTVNGLPAVTCSDPAMVVVGAVFDTVKVALAVVDEPASVTLTTALPVNGPSLMPRASRLAQVRVGVRPVASVNTESPLRSQAYVTPVPVADPVASRASEPP